MCPFTFLHPPFTLISPLRSSASHPSPPKCLANRIIIPQIHYSTPPRHSSARVSILTDFSSNPMTAVTDRLTDPLSAAMLLFAVAIGALVAKLTSSRRVSVEEVEEMVSVNDEGEVTVLGADQVLKLIEPGKVGGATTGENAVWLNMSLRTMWRLFRRSTNCLTRDVLQPVLDDMELPSFVKEVKIIRLTLGESPALVRRIERLPSRSLNEIQYRFGARLVGDKKGTIEMTAKVSLPGTPLRVSVPITVSELDIDAKVWLGATVVPYQPWISFVQWSLVEMPLIKLKVDIAKIIPLSFVPLLSGVVNKVLTQDLPREFLLPNTQIVDMMGEGETDVDIEKRMLEARGIKMRGMDEVAEEELKQLFPELVALFESMDLNDNGVLGTREVSDGLIEWGYASEADRNSIWNLLDVNNDGKVYLRDFISVWGDLKNVFVPRHFQGILTGVLLKAEGLRSPLFGPTDPYVEFRIESQTTVSKKNKATSKTGRRKGSAVWNEGWELFVREPETAVLCILVREGCRFTYYKEHITPVPQLKEHSGTGLALSPTEQANDLDKVIGYGTIPMTEVEPTAQTKWIELTKGGGRVCMDLQFNEFVDPRAM